MVEFLLICWQDLSIQSPRVLLSSHAKPRLPGSKVSLFPMSQIFPCLFILPHWLLPAEEGAEHRLGWSEYCPKSLQPIGTAKGTWPRRDQSVSFLRFISGAAKTVKASVLFCGLPTNCKERGYSLKGSIICRATNYKQRGYYYSVNGSAIWRATNSK